MPIPQYLRPGPETTRREHEKRIRALERSPGASALEWEDVGAAGAGGAGGITIEEEGNPLTPRSVLNFTGNGVTASDDSSTGKTIVNVPGTALLNLTTVGVTASFVKVSAGDGYTWYAPIWQNMGTYKNTLAVGYGNNVGNKDVLIVQNDTPPYWYNLRVHYSFDTLDSETTPLEEHTVDVRPVTLSGTSPYPVTGLASFAPGNSGQGYWAGAGFSVSASRAKHVESVAPTWYSRYYITAQGTVRLWGSGLLGFSMNLRSLLPNLDAPINNASQMWATVFVERLPLTPGPP